MMRKIDITIHIIIWKDVHLKNFYNLLKDSTMSDVGTKQFVAKLIAKGLCLLNCYRFREQMFQSAICYAPIPLNYYIYTQLVVFILRVQFMLQYESDWIIVMANKFIFISLRHLNTCILSINSKYIVLQNAPIFAFCPFN